MTFIHHDGGRQAAGFVGKAGDCAVRACAIALDRPYREVYDAINALAKHERHDTRKASNARTGVWPATVTAYLAQYGWRWTPTMQVGQGCRVHLRREELPPGRLVVRLSRHFAAVIDGVVYDTHNPVRDGTRCVYGYWQKEER